MSPNERASNVRWLIFGLSCLSSWFLYLHRYTYQFIRPALQEEYGFSNTQLGTIESAFSLAYAAGQIPSGIICDLFGAHIFLGLSICGWSLMLLLLTTTGNLYLLAVIRFLFGAGQAGAYPSLAKVTRVWFPTRIRTSLQGWIASFFGRSGGALSPILMGGLLMGVMGFSWRAALIIFSVVGLLFGAVFLWLFRSTPRQDSRVNQAELDLISEGAIENQKSDRNELKNREGGLPLPPHSDRTTSKVDGCGMAPSRVLPVRRLVRSFTFYVFAFQAFLSAGADVIFVSLLGSYFMDTRGIDIKASAIFISLPLFGGALGGLFGGYLNDGLIARTGSRRWSRSAVGFTGKFVACILLFVAIRQINPVHVAMALFATKFFGDWSQPTTWGACTDLGGRYSGTFVGIINMCGNIGAMVMPIVFGVVLDFYSTFETVDGETVRITNFDPVFKIGALMFLGAAASWFLIDCTKTFDPQDQHTKPE